MHNQTISARSALGGRLSGVRRRALSRRRFLALGASAGAAGLLAGCALGQRSSASGPTATSVRPLRVIEPENARQLGALGTLRRAGTGALRGPAWSPDGRFVAIGASSAVQLWNAEALALVTTLHTQSGLVRWMDWSPDGRWLAAVAEDAGIQVLNTQRDQVEKTLSSPYGGLLTVAWSPDSARLLTGDRIGKAVVWDAAAGKPVMTLTGLAPRSTRGQHPQAVFGVAWTPDGERCATTRYDGLVQVWNARTGAALAHMETDASPNGVAWSPDGRTLASTSDSGAVQLWDGATYHNTATLVAPDNAGWSYPVSWSPDGRLLACAGSTGVVQVWAPGSGTRLAALAGHTDTVWGMRWSPDGKRIVSCSDDGTAILWGVR
jgi:WD40 repeat protein